LTKKLSGEKVKPLGNPSVSILMPTLNSAEKIKACLDSIAKQDYPQNKIEVIIVDGGSTDNTLAIAKQYSWVKVLKTSLPGPEAARAIALKKARGELIAIIDSDNILPKKGWLKEMITPLLKDKNLVGSQTLHYTYVREESLLNRYFALFGVNDPVGYYLKKADRMPYFDDQWHGGGKAINRGSYIEVEFKDKKIPTLGSNGAIFRKSIYQKGKVGIDECFHMDVVQDIVNLGYTHFAVVKNDIIHSTALTLFSLMKKRIRYLKMYYKKRLEKRRYLVFDPRSFQDRINLSKFIFFTTTFVEPLSQSIKGFLKIHDPAWFLHPFLCWFFLIAYFLGCF
jgi:glycosyltransferase involved in cell wall biosynthesis